MLSLLEATGVLSWLAPEPNYPELLVEAARDNESTLELCLALLQKAQAADVDSAASTAWHCAAALDRVELLRLFVRGSLAGINALDAAGQTPLHAAVAANACGAVHVLLRANASLEPVNAAGAKASALCERGSAVHRAIRAAERAEDAQRKPGGPRYARGDAVHYATRDGTLLEAVVLRAHLDDEVAYYTIRVGGGSGGEDGRERQTIESRLLEIAGE